MRPGAGPAGTGGVRIRVFVRAGDFSVKRNRIMTALGGGLLVWNDARLVTNWRYHPDHACMPVARHEHADIWYNHRLGNGPTARGQARRRRLQAMPAYRAAPFRSCP